MSAKGLAAHVSAVAPLSSVIDGSRRPVPANRQKRAPTTECKPVETTWVCPACDRKTQDPADQARHLARELGAASTLISELQLAEFDLAAAIPGYLDAVGDARRGLSEEDVRRAHAVRIRLRRAGIPVPEAVEAAGREYHRRRQARFRRAVGLAHDPMAWTPLPGGRWRAPGGAIYKSDSAIVAKVKQRRAQLVNQ